MMVPGAAPISGGMLSRSASKSLKYIAKYFVRVNALL
jgi:hypothetical protein